MADNELLVQTAVNTIEALRTVDVSNVNYQFVIVAPGPELPVSLTGGLNRFQVDNSPSVALDPPNATAHVCRLRVYEATQSTSLRLYYRQDGTVPTTDGANASGYLLHGEMIEIKLAVFTNFRLIAEGTGVWECYMDWLAYG